MDEFTEGLAGGIQAIISMILAWDEGYQGTVKRARRMSVELARTMSPVELIDVHLCNAKFTYKNMRSVLCSPEWVASNFQGYGGKRREVPRPHKNING